MRLKPSKRDAIILSHWHSSASDPIYALSSSWYAGRSVPLNVGNDALGAIRAILRVGAYQNGRTDNGWTKRDMEILGNVAKRLLNKINKAESYAKVKGGA